MMVSLDVGLFWFWTEQISTRVEDTCLTLFAGGHKAVHLVRLCDVQLGSLHHLRELWTLVEGAAQTGLPGGWVVLPSVRQLPFELCPRLRKVAQTSC